MMGDRFSILQQFRAIAIVDGSELPSWLSFGERVIVIYRQGLEFIATCFGCLYAGVVAIPAPALRKQHG
jgi:acyl-CoA synthetase (AMP-forming)/AMP-acid ligase II